MSELDDRIREGLERLAPRADGSGAMDDVARRKRRRRTVRRTRAGALAVAVVLGSAAGVWGLSRGFDRQQPAAGPAVGPTPEPTASASPGACDEGSPGSGPIDEIEADVLGDGSPAMVRLLADEEGPLACRYFLSLQAPDGGPLAAAVPPVEGVPSVPEVLMAAEIDGEPGHEIVVDIGGPGHPHRAGVVFTAFEGALVPMTVGTDPGTHPSPFVPLGGEFGAGVDCAGEPGTIVVTWGSFADGDDRRYDITREFFRADGAAFERFDRETFTVEVGEEGERWPETADDPFRSCPR